VHETRVHPRIHSNLNSPITSIVSNLSHINIKGVIFDLDATLVNLGEHVRWRDAQHEVIETYIACGCSEDLLKQNDSKGLFNLIHEIDTLLASSKPPGECKSIQDRIWHILDNYELEGTGKCGFMPGTLEVLEWLRNHNIRLGICTSNSTKVAMMILDKLDVAPYFSAVIGRTPSLRMKPYPDQILACFKELKLNPMEGIVVGDSHNDILAGKTAGARTIAIPVYFTRKEAMEAAKPDIVINSILELPKVLLSLK
jgi:phosphoglycolate phosphatase